MAASDAESARRKRRALFLVTGFYVIALGALIASISIAARYGQDAAVKVSVYWLISLSLMIAALRLSVVLVGAYIGHFGKPRWMRRR